MKKIISMFCLLGLCLAANAQHFISDKRNSLEFSVGYLPLAALLGDYYKPLGADEYANMSTNAPVGFNASYLYDMNEKWTFQALIDVSTVNFVIGNQNNESKRLASQTTAALAAVFRCKWFVSESVRMYSSFGVGIDPWLRINDGIVPWPLPYLTPLGINFGKKTVYGVSELSVSPAATSWLIGLGIRL